MQHFPKSSANTQMVGKGRINRSLTCVTQKHLSLSSSSVPSDYECWHNQGLRIDGSIKIS